MMEPKFSAIRWAMEMTHFWKLASPNKRFPVDVEAIALEVSRVRYPKDPLKAVKGGDIPGFEGALCPLNKPRDGWAIIYNSTGISDGRKRFTIAHEYGHYLAHRQMLPEGVECDSKAITRRDGAGIEKEADEFAAYLLMPFDDFKVRIPPPDKPSIDDLIACANRYGVSLIAATLRWLEYTERRAVFVVSRDGGAKWACSSEPAYRSGRFIRTTKETYMLPETSAAVREQFDSAGRASAIHPPGVWFPEETEEVTIRSRTYDLSLTLLHLPREVRYAPIMEPVEVDTFDRLTGRL